MLSVLSISSCTSLSSFSERRPTPVSTPPPTCPPGYLGEPPECKCFEDNTAYFGNNAVTGQENLQAGGIFCWKTGKNRRFEKIVEEKIRNWSILDLSGTSLNVSPFSSSKRLYFLIHDRLLSCKIVSPVCRRHARRVNAHARSTPRASSGRGARGRPGAPATSRPPGRT